MERERDELADLLRRKEYRASAVRRVWVPNPGGKQRPLGIPRILDRVVMVAAGVVLEPIFDVGLPDEQHGYSATCTCAGSCWAGRKSGLEARLRAKIVACADDYVICCKGDADEAMAGMQRLMERLELTVNEAKTHIRQMPDDRFDFLGYTFGRYCSPKTGRAYLCVAARGAQVAVALAV